MAKTEDKNIFIDTNILVYLTDSISDFFQITNENITEFYKNDINLYISNQVLREYLAVVTRINRLSKIDIQSNLQIFKRNLFLLQDCDEVFENLESFMYHYSITGSKIHDANIVATMQYYGIKSILTHNTKDFEQFSDLINIIPLIV